MKYRVYEGTPESRDDTASFATKKEAIRYCRSRINYRAASQENWIAHVTIPKTRQIVETFCTPGYYDALDSIAREEAAWKAQMVRDTKRVEIRDQFKAIMDKANVLFEMAGPNRHRGHQDAWLLCASAMDNASDTAKEKGWDYEGLEYWECALDSLESLCCYASPRIRRWFKKIGFKF